MSALLVPVSDLDAGNVAFLDCVGEWNPDGDVDFRYGGGHSGFGWYANCGEYPEEGSAKLHPPSGDVQPERINGQWFWRRLGGDL